MRAVQQMTEAVGWVVVAWVLLSLPLGMFLGAALRQSSVGLAAKPSPTHRHASGWAPRRHSLPNRYVAQSSISSERSYLLHQPRSAPRAATLKQAGSPRVHGAERARHAHVAP